MKYDLVVIGGGPSGIISAIRASENGGRVLILEKNKSLGVKLLVTGHGRCNITNTNADNKEFLNVYGLNYKFLYSAFNKFSIEKTLEFFKKIGINTVIQDNGRVFPESNKARDVLDALIRILKKNKVEVMYSAYVKKIFGKGKKIEKVVLKNKDEIVAKNYIIATGGKSYPETGSIGDGYEWLTNLGHSINSPRPALSPIIVKEKYVKNLEGLSLKDVGISVYKNNHRPNVVNKKITSLRGSIIFTADGISGPAIIDLSSLIGSYLPQEVILKLDLFPEIRVEELEKKIQENFHHSNNKMFKNYLFSLVQPKFAAIVFMFIGIDKKKPVNTISKEDRKKLVSLLKEFTFKVEALKGFEKAMITAGGVDVREIDPKTMRSKFYKNLYLAGEVLDLDGPSGGYNLQICWSTGYTAGDSV